MLADKVQILVTQYGQIRTESIADYSAHSPIIWRSHFVVKSAY